jgi:hypothetical protein
MNPPSNSIAFSIKQHTFRKGNGLFSGAGVTVHSLTSEAGIKCNGKNGTLCYLNAEKTRWLVEVAIDGIVKKKNIKIANLNGKEFPPMTDENQIITLVTIASSIHKEEMTVEHLKKLWNGGVITSRAVFLDSTRDPAYVAIANNNVKMLSFLYDRSLFNIHGHIISHRDIAYSLKHFGAHVSGKTPYFMLMCMQGCLKAAKWLHKRNPLIINTWMEKMDNICGMKMLPHDLCVMAGHAKMAKWIRKQGGRSDPKSLEKIARGPPSLSQDLNHGYSAQDNKEMAEFHSANTKVRASILKKLEQKACTACGKIGAKLKCSLCGAVNETRYCNAICQKNHWPEHKLGECGVLAKKLKKEKKKKKKKKKKKECLHLVKEIEKNEANGKNTKEDKTTDIKQETPIQEAEDVEDCPICTDALPKISCQFVRLTCCGKGLHHKCAKDLRTNKSMTNEQKDTCIMCRTKVVADGSKQEIETLSGWVKKGKAWAMSMLADRYLEGVGVKQSDTKAIELLEMAAKRGHATAQYNLGVCYRQGTSGLSKSYKKAFEFYTLAANQGQSAAQASLGIMYANGDEGIEQSLTKARELFTKAAAQGNEQAIEALKKFDKLGL